MPISIDAAAKLAPLSTLPPLGLDLRGWTPPDATESDSGGSSGAQSVTYQLAGEDTGFTVTLAQIRVSEIQARSVYETSQWWMDRTDYEPVDISGHEARRFTTDGDYESRWLTWCCG